VSSNVELAASVATSVLSCGGLWTAGQWIMRRKERIDARDKAKRQNAQQAEKDREDRARKQRELEDMLAVSRVAAQKVAIDSWKESYGRLETDYDKCYAGLVALRDAGAALINVFEGFLVRMHPTGEDGQTYTAIIQLSELGEARRAINDARQHLR
jgi:hypothetical protein